MPVVCFMCVFLIFCTLCTIYIINNNNNRVSHNFYRALHCSAQRCNAITIVILLHDCKPEGPLFSAEFVCESACLSACLSVCLSVCVCVSDRHFYPSTLTDFDETWSQGPLSGNKSGDLGWTSTYFLGKKIFSTTDI